MIPPGQFQALDVATVIDTKSTVAIIIVNWNGVHHLRELLPAMASQTRAPDEIIVVDNASTDGSLDFIQATPGVKLIALPSNRGFAGGNVAGLESTKCDYVVLLNNDTLPAPGWLAALTRCADDCSDVGIVASVMTTWDGNQIDTAGDGCTVTGRGFKLKEGKPVDTLTGPSYVFSGCAGAALYKRQMLLEIGFLDERFFLNGEDTDLAFRANLLGWRAIVCTAALVRHRVSGSLGQHSDKAVFFSARNHIWLFYKCMPQRLMVKYLPALILHQLIYLVHFLRIGRGQAFLRGLLAAIGGLGQFRLDRRDLQARRKISIADLESRLEPLGRYLATKSAWKTARRAEVVE